jgi:lipopolysaccharide transport system permease protein
MPAFVAALAIVQIRRAGILHIGHTDLPYGAYVFFGMMLWQTFLEALQGPIQAISGERTLIRNQILPVESIILAKQGELIINFAIKFLFILLVLLWFGVKIQWTTIFMPFAVLTMVLFATSIGLILAPFNLLYQDVSKGIVFVGTVWLFFTPVIYPRPVKGSIAAIINLNPVTPLIVTIRELVTSTQLTQLPAFFIVLSLTLLVSAIAWLVFRVALPHAIERLNH